MTRIKNLAEAEQVLAAYIPIVREMTGKDITLERMTPLMESLGNPQNEIKVIHIAGTSGKTSTAYYIASLLKQSGQRTGLTVSPHVDSVTERIQIDLNHIPEKDLCTNLEEFIDTIKNLTMQPSYFELLMAFAYWYFAKMRVDYAVIETGLGGLHDASNVANHSDKICVITDIGYDHMHVLGRSLRAITGQKSGIIHNKNQVFMYAQSKIVNGIVEEYVSKQNAILNMLSESEEKGMVLNLKIADKLPQYQQRNWLLAQRVYQYLIVRDNLPPLSSQKLMCSMDRQIPGRMDISTVQGKTLIMDGAHNEQKMLAFVKSFQALYAGKKSAIVLALKQGKEYAAVMPLLLPICSRLILTTFDGLQDLPSKSIDPKILARAAKKYGFNSVEIEENANAALARLIGCPEELIVITGSFYLLSYIRSHMEDLYT